MPNTRISEETAAAALDGSELFVGVQSGANVKITASQVASFASSLTRADISTSTPPAYFTVGGYATHGDIGAGAKYTSTDADANSFGAIQDSAGTWYRLIVDGPVNVGWFGLVNDGVTDNNSAMAVLRAELPKLGEAPPQTVTVTIATPAVFTLAAHGFIQGTPVKFTTTGALPTGITAGKLYYVTLANLTEDTFSVSTTNPAITLTEETAINTSGSQSGVHTVVACGRNWIEVLFPPGVYSFTPNARLGQSGIKKLRVYAYGAVMNNLLCGGQWLLNGDTGAFDSDASALFNVVSTGINSYSITLTDAGDADIFHVGDWVYLSALECQGTGSYPPNHIYNEYQQISDITGAVITFARNGRLKHSYKPTYPAYGYAAGTTIPSGPARVFRLHHTWDCDIEVYGARDSTSAQHYHPGKYVKIVDEYDDGQGCIPTATKQFVAENCTFVNGYDVDKSIESLTLRDCTTPGVTVASAGSVDRMEIDGCNVELFYGTAGNTIIKNSNISMLTVGPISLGAAESVIIENSRINSFGPAQTLEDQAIGALNNLVEDWTFSNGTLSKTYAAIGSGSAINWAVPGGKYFVKNLGGGSTKNFGSPFAILDVLADATTVSLQTTLTSKPTGNSTNSTATITIASPAVVSWTSHGLSAGDPITFLTTGALPTGITEGGLYYVLASGLGANDFKFAASAGGTAINTSGSQSGTHTAVANPLMFTRHQCPRLTVRGSTGCPLIGALSQGPDDVPLFSYSKRLYTWNSAGTNTIYVTHPTVWGNLVSLSVNVIKAYSGATNPLTLAITATAYDSDLLSDDLSLTIDMRTTGLRTITPTAATGSVGTDSIAAFSSWISGAVTPVFSTDLAAEALSDCPIFEIEITTDQGVTGYNVIQWYDDLNSAAPAAIVGNNTSANN